MAQGAVGHHCGACRLAMALRAPVSGRHIAQHGDGGAQGPGCRLIRRQTCSRPLGPSFGTTRWLHRHRCEALDVGQRVPAVQGDRISGR